MNALRNQNLFSVALGLWLLLSTSGILNAQTTFSNFGISFSLPMKWVVKTQNENEQFSFINIRRKGLGQSGMISVRIEKDSLDFPWNIEYWKKSIELRMMGGAQISDELIGSFGKYPAKQFTYKTSLLSVSHSGRCVFIVFGGKKVAVFYQHADEDFEQYQEAYEQFEAQFQIGN